MTKIYSQGNYIVIEANNERNAFPKKGVGFEIVNDDGLYSLNYKGLPIGDFNYSEVKKKDGSDYATALEFETFLFENTGNFNSGADVSPNYNDYSIDEIQIGRFIYRNDNGDKVSKPKYRKVIEFITEEDFLDNCFNISNKIGNFEKICKTPDISWVDDGNVYYGFSINGGTVSNCIWLINNFQIYAINSIDASVYNLSSTGLIKLDVLIEYTKTTDTETVIELAI